MHILFGEIYFIENFRVAAARMGRSAFLLAFALTGLLGGAGNLKAADCSDAVEELVAKHLLIDRSKVAKSATLKSLNADDLDVVELVMAIEMKFEFEITDSEEKQFKSVGDITEMVNKRAKTGCK